MSYSAFFYGTLMHPTILRRVIGHEGSELQICPAVLLRDALVVGKWRRQRSCWERSHVVERWETSFEGTVNVQRSAAFCSAAPFASAVNEEHTRHKIKNEDYPAVIPYSDSRILVEESGRGDLSPEDRTVRGTLVQGLNDRDISLLDLFEGDEYTRGVVAVHPLGPLAQLSPASGQMHTAPSAAPASTETQGAHPDAGDATTDAYVVPRTAPKLPHLQQLAPAVYAQTYIYADSLSGLSAELWSYDDFVRESAWKWVGGNPVLGEYYAEVDRRREMEGKTLKGDGVC